MLSGGCTRSQSLKSGKYVARCTSSAVAFVLDEEEDHADAFVGPGAPLLDVFRLDESSLSPPFGLSSSPSSSCACVMQSFHAAKATARSRQKSRRAATSSAAAGALLAAPTMPSEAAVSLTIVVNSLRGRHGTNFLFTFAAGVEDVDESGKGMKELDAAGQR